MNVQILKEQLDKILASYNKLTQLAKRKDLSDLPKPDRQALVTQTCAAVDRISGVNSTYSREIARIIKTNPHLHEHTSAVIGVAKALRDDLEAGYLKTLAELVHADIFADFLEMAAHLLEKNYKDAAAVISGSTLESHLRKLAEKFDIDTEDANGRPVKADKLNADLAKAEVYGKLDQKSITAWLDLRNNAAHGQYRGYSEEQVKLMVSGIRDFISRNQA